MTELKRKRNISKFRKINFNIPIPHIPLHGYIVGKDCDALSNFTLTYHLQKLLSQ